MKFLIDAQLPKRLAAELKQAGFEATHTLELPEGNRTTDQALISPRRNKNQAFFCAFCASLWQHVSEGES